VPALIVGGASFAVVNAALEELAYRGVMLEALRATLPTTPAVLIQAAAFGAIHIEGFPRGIAGVVLAMGFGCLMALIRLRAGGMMGPWIGHVLTDAVIVGLLLEAT
jgi:hypothetical protein